jgi:hypothetical protein
MTMWTTTILVALVPFTLAAPSRVDKRDTTQIFDGAQVGGKTYDYVIAGGGLGGMVTAARLSEDSSKTVLVLEAGYSEEDRQDVTGQALIPFVVIILMSRYQSIPEYLWSKFTL